MAPRGARSLPWKANTTSDGALEGFVYAAFAPSWGEALFLGKELGANARASVLRRKQVVAMSA
jgi:hypothetical protein